MLEIQGLSKSFGGNRALHEVDLTIATGQVHALLGQNGSGKSTLIKILSGIVTADAGRVSLRGQELPLPLTQAELRRRGMAFLHQDLGLVVSGTVLENISVGHYPAGAGGHIRWGEARAVTRRLLAQFQLEIDPDTLVSELSQSQRAIVGIARALRDIGHTNEPGLLVLDEPTASLPRTEVAELFSAIRAVKAQGSSILFVSHRLDEVLEISDTVSVLRDGNKVADAQTAELDHEKLIELIVGSRLDKVYPNRPENHAVGEVVFEASDLTGKVARGVSLRIRRGEMVGITGLIGAGHDELPYLICGAVPGSGSVTLNGEPIARLNPARCRDRGLLVLPADRQQQGAIMAASVRENLTASALGKFFAMGILHSRREERAAADLITRYEIHPNDSNRTIATLSGGNQQKAILARLLLADPTVIVLHEPTQGVDVGARHALFEILQSLTAEGLGILYASAEYEDLASLCDRVIVMAGGEIHGELSGEQLSAGAILQTCYRAEAAVGAHCA